MAEATGDAAALLAKRRSRGEHGTLSNAVMLRSAGADLHITPAPDGSRAEARGPRAEAPDPMRPPRWVRARAPGGVRGPGSARLRAGAEAPARVCAETARVYASLQRQRPRERSAPKRFARWGSSGSAPRYATLSPLSDVPDAGPGRGRGWRRETVSRRADMTTRLRALPREATTAQPTSGLCSADESAAFRRRCR